jgi:hypothetical protein
MTSTSSVVPSTSGVVIVVATDFCPGWVPRSVKL